MKTSELTGAALDWAVCEATGLLAAYTQFRTGKNFLKVWGVAKNAHLHPSTDWAQGGPIIERELLMIEPVFWTVEGWHWVAYVLGPNNLDENYEQRGSTPLIAAMRCYVASKLGDNIEIPEELK